MITEIEVPKDLSVMSRADLTALRDRLVAAGCRAGGIDDRLKTVAKALRKRGDGRKPVRKPKENFRFGSLGSVAGDKFSRLRDG
jgi:hypothetical protein